MLDLGPFQLHSFVAGGGMGTVWSGIHRARGTPVAIKVVNVPPGELDTSVRIELEAMARLTHPHIVGLHGYGRIPEGTPTRDARLAPGSLWMAMEMAERGTLEDQGITSWAELQPVLLDLLGALAYAHARDVIHRDIKPANVLIAGGQRQARLSDFGIAYALERTLSPDEGPLQAGTPAYMPPEQETGDAILQGPWTDVFAFGVMVWKLVAGGYPWGTEARRFLFRKMSEQTERFSPRFPVPADLEGWLRTCMRARAELRFATAADAAWALRALAPVKAGRHGPTRPLALDRATAPTEADEAAAPTEVLSAGALPQLDQPTDEPPAGRRPPAPPMHTEGLARAEVDARDLVNAGLELLTLRERRTIGRIAERARLWEALVAVRRTGEARAIALEGPSGVGKTHLAWALARRAHELGAALTAHVDLELGGPTGGFRGMVLRQVRYTGTDPDEARLAVGLLDPFFPPEREDDDDVLVDALCPPASGLPEASAMEAVTRLLRRMSRDRPVVLVLDGPPDAGPTVARFLDHLAARALDAPLLLTIAAPVPELPHPWVERLALADLPEDDRVAFVRELLGLDPTLAHKVARISAGNPGYAFEVVRSWAQRELLEPGPSGYRLRKGARAPVPRSAFAAWGERVDALLDAHPGWARPLMLAATLGAPIDDLTWGLALGPDRAHAGPLVDALVAAGLARREEAGWAFATRAITTAVLDRAKRAGQLRALHEAAAEAVRAGPHPEPDRLARHLLGAGRFADALDPLLQAAALATEQGRYTWVLELLDDWERAAERVQLPAADPRRGEVLVTRAGALCFLFREDELLATCEDAVARARQHGWPDAEVAALVRTTWARKVPLPTQRTLLQRAQQLVDAHGLDGRRAELARAMGHVDIGQGQLAAGLACFEEATRAARDHGGPPLHACVGEQASALTLLGRLDEATELAEACDRLAAAARSASGRTIANHHLGRIHLLRGDYGAAARAFAQARALCRRTGDGQEWYVHALAGLAERFAGDLDSSRRTFRECLDAPVRLGGLLASCGMATLTAADPGWEELLAPAERMLARGGCDLVIARTLELAAEHALEVGRPDRALHAYRLALTNHDRLGNTVEADDLRSVVVRLQGDRVH